jgi:hypothetical protein
MIYDHISPNFCRHMSPIICEKQGGPERCTRLDRKCELQKMLRLYKSRSDYTKEDATAALRPLYSAREFQASWHA